MFDYQGTPNQNLVFQFASVKLWLWTIIEMIDRQADDTNKLTDTPCMFTHVVRPGGDPDRQGGAACLLLEADQAGLERLAHRPRHNLGGAGRVRGLACTWGSDIESAV